MVNISKIFLLSTPPRKIFRRGTRGGKKFPEESSWVFLAEDFPQFSHWTHSAKASLSFIFNQSNL